MASWARRSTWELVLGVILLATIVFNLTQSTGYLGVDNFVNLFQLHIEKVIVVITMTFVIVAGEIDLSGVRHGLVGRRAGDASRARRTDGRRDRGRPRRGRAGRSDQRMVCRQARPAIARRHARRAHRVARWPGSSWRIARSVVPHLVPTTRPGRPRRPAAVAVLLFPVLFAIGWVVLHRSATGRVLYVIGDNAEVARYRGSMRPHPAGPVHRVVVAAGVAGILFAAGLGSVRGDMANGYELEIITIVLLGGVSILAGPAG